MDLTGRDLQRTEILSDVLAKRRTVVPAAAILELSTRQTGRLLTAYRDDGGAALILQARGHTSNKCLLSFWHGQQSRGQRGFSENRLASTKYSGRGMNSRMPLGACVAMPLPVSIRSRDPLDYNHKSAAYDRVLQQMESILLPCSNSVICLLDNREFDQFKLSQGQANRGYFMPLLEVGAEVLACPYYFNDSVLSLNSVTDEMTYLYDCLVYLHGSTCSTDLGLTSTLAHELCHFAQYSAQCNVWAANQLLSNLGRPYFTQWTEIPIEVEARQVAKRVAEAIFGDHAVQEFVAQRERSAQTADDAADWRFIASLTTSASYPTAESTMVLVEKYRPQLRIVQARFPTRHVVSRLDLDTLKLAPKV